MLAALRLYLSKNAGSHKALEKEQCVTNRLPFILFVATQTGMV